MATKEKKPVPAIMGSVDHPILAARQPVPAAARANRCRTGIRMGLARVTPYWDTACFATIIVAVALIVGQT